jgi:microcystin-dependent protein
MAEPFLAELRIFSFDFAPKGWAQCNGQLLPINQNQALFSLLGTQFGGDGRVNFALPNLQDRVPMHVGGSFQPNPGQTGGEAAHTLTSQEMPVHTHFLQGSNTQADQVVPTGNVFATAGGNTYNKVSTGATTLLPGTISNYGGSQPHENRSPYIALNICIALQGIFPTQN